MVVGVKKRTNRRENRRQILKIGNRKTRPTLQPMDYNLYANIMKAMKIIRLQ